VKAKPLPLCIMCVTLALFATGNVLGWVTHDPQTAGNWGGGGSVALLATSFALFTFSIAGFLIASRQPQNPVGWILLAIGFSWAIDSALEGYALYGLKLHPGSLPAAAYADLFDQWLWVVGVGLMGTLLFQLFPDGRALTPRWRVLAYVSIAALAVTVLSDLLAPVKLADSVVPATQNPLGIEAIGGLTAAGQNALVVLLLCVPLSAVSLLVRYHRSRGETRQQLKWLVSATAAIVVFYVAVLTISGAPSPPLWLMILQDAAIVSFCLIPISIGVAVLRYRLYEIDVIVRRTVVYSLLLASLAAMYLGGVAVLGWIGRDLTGQGGTLGVTLSTLLVAITFQPLRARIQSAVNRRFYRQRYDAETAIAAFSSTLRSEIDLSTLQRELLAVVDQTVHPVQVALWIRPSGRAPAV
jgi:hypothetical protein